MWDPLSNLPQNALGWYHSTSAPPTPTPGVPPATPGLPGATPGSNPAAGQGSGSGMHYGGVDWQALMHGGNMGLWQSLRHNGWAGLTPDQTTQLGGLGITQDMFGGGGARGPGMFGGGGMGGAGIPLDQRQQWHTDIQNWRQGMPQGDGALAGYAPRPVRPW